MTACGLCINSPKTQPCLTRAAPARIYLPLVCRLSMCGRAKHRHRGPRLLHCSRSRLLGWSSDLRGAISHPINAFPHLESGLKPLAEAAVFPSGRVIMRDQLDPSKLPLPRGIARQVPSSPFRQTDNRVAAVSLNGIVPPFGQVVVRQEDNIVCAPR